MKLKQLFTDDDAVSPVIGVILMVAITVILAAVIATFVIGLGDSAGTDEPTASFSIEYTEDTSPTWASSSDTGYLTIEHNSGDSIQAEELELSGNNVDILGEGGWEDQYTETGTTDTDASTDSDISSSDRIYVLTTADPYDLTLTWSPPNEDTSKKLSEASNE